MMITSRVMTLDLATHRVRRSNAAAPPRPGAPRAARRGTIRPEKLTMTLHAIRRTARFAIVVLVALTAVPHARSQNRRAMTETDLFKFTWIADPQISPDGSQIAFVRAVVNEKEDRYETSIYAVDTSGTGATTTAPDQAAADASGRTTTAPVRAYLERPGEPRRLTGGIRDVAPRWSPDGKRLAFLRSPEKDGKVQPSQIFVMSMAGGEARQLTDLPRGAGAPEWSPDGKTLAFTVAMEPSELEKKDEKKDEKTAGNTDEKKDAKRTSDVRVITRAVYRSNGPGYLNPDRHSHIWTVAVPDDPMQSVTPKALTSGAFDENGIVWAPDGSRIYYTSTRVAEPYYQPGDSDLFAVPAAGGEPVKIASIEGTIGEPVPSPDGQRIAFVGTLHGKPVRSYSQPDLFVTSASPDSTPKNLTDSYDFDIGGGIGGDQRAPRGSQSSSAIWSKDGRTLTIVVAEHGSANLKRIDAATGKVTALTEAKQDVMAYTATPDAATLALLVSTPTNIGDLFRLDAATGKTTRLTHINQDLFRDIAQSEPEEIWYTSFDGRKIQGWILKPPDFDASKRYPLILEIHGGPHGAYGNTMTHEFSWMAAKGYVVLYTNPRGSTSYGQDFGNIIQYHYPGDDYKDLMAGVDEILKKGYIDEKRMGVTGGSGGGVLTNWTIGHTNRFAAAVSQRSIADWAGFWYTADFTLFQPTWFRGAPWEDPKDFTARSPITYIKDITTPLMLIEGEADMRTPPADGGEQMFRALKYLKRPVVMVRFPDETHELSRSGKPWHRVERLQHIVGWFDKYLQGKSVPTYER
jgi:dipeptidyl aminopeptidase/acylaminoacyl peptidase